MPGSEPQAQPTPMKCPLRVWCFYCVGLQTLISARQFGIFPGVSQTPQTPRVLDRRIGFPTAFPHLLCVPISEDGIVALVRPSPTPLSPPHPPIQPLRSPLGFTAIPKPTSYHLDPTQLSPLAWTTTIISLLVSQPPPFPPIAHSPRSSQSSSFKT